MDEFRDLNGITTAAAITENNNERQCKSPSSFKYVDKLAQLLDTTPFTTQSMGGGGPNIDLLSGLDENKIDESIATPLCPQKVAPPSTNSRQQRQQFDKNDHQRSITKDDMFEDLLPEMKRSSTLNNLKGPIGGRPKLEDCLGFDADLTLLKIDEWKKSRCGNIRALLSSLHTVLTDDFKSWQPIGMHQLIAEKDVKKVYRDACLLLHPDKVHNEQARETAKIIFMVLNDAWQKFENK